MKTFNSFFSRVCKNLDNKKGNRFTGLSGLFSSLLLTLLLSQPGLASENTEKTNQIVSENSVQLTIATKSALLDNFGVNKQIDYSKLSNSSVVDFLLGLGIKDTSFESRKQIYLELIGIFPTHLGTKYQGSIQQNKYIIDNLTKYLTGLQTAKVEPIQPEASSSSIVAIAEPQKSLEQTSKIDSKDTISTCDKDRSARSDLLQLDLNTLVDQEIVYTSKKSQKTYNGKIVGVKSTDQGKLVLQISLTQKNKKTSTLFSVDFSDTNELFKHISFANKTVDPKLEPKVNKTPTDKTITPKDNVTQTIYNPYIGTNPLDKNTGNFTGALKFEKNNHKSSFISWLAPMIENIKVKMDMEEFPTSLILAAGARESGWGRNARAQKTNNLFGIMASETQLMRFNSIEEGIQYYIKTLSSKRAYSKFQKVLGNDSLDPKQKVVHLTDALNSVYAQGEDSHNYSKKLQVIIAQNGLLRYDIAKN